MTNQTFPKAIYSLWLIVFLILGAVLLGFGLFHITHITDNTVWGEMGITWSTNARIAFDSLSILGGITALGFVVMMLRDSIRGMISIMLIILISSCTKKNCIIPVVDSTAPGTCNINVKGTNHPLEFVPSDPNTMNQYPIPIALGGRHIIITCSEAFDYMSITNYAAGTNLGNILPEAYRSLQEFDLPPEITKGDSKISIRMKNGHEYYGAFRIP